MYNEKNKTESCASLTTIEIDLNNQTYKKVQIPSSVTQIDSSAFSNCNQLSEIRINKKKDSITGAPWGCNLGDRGIFWES